MKTIKHSEVLFSINIGITINGRMYYFSPFGVFKRFEDNFSFFVKTGD